MIGLCILTILLVSTIPSLSIPVLFPEISAELDLTVVQLGIAWGSLSFSGMFIGLIGGALGDRIGARRSLGIACFLAGIFGAMRGLMPSFPLLLLSFLLFGFVAGSLPANLHKAAAYFFPNRRGIAAGSISTGYALGLFLGGRFLATVISPAVGGWRNVTFLFGTLAIILAIIWLFLIPNTLLPKPSTSDTPFFPSLIKGLRHITQLREVWLIGIGSAFFMACFKGFQGYTPTYLRSIGWEAIRADSTFSIFFLASLICVIPFTLVSEKSNNRTLFLILGNLFMAGGILLIGFGWIPLGIILSGMIFDAFMGIHQAALIDVDGVGYTYTGTAVGFGIFLKETASFLSPPIGNALVQYGAHIPYFFWGTLAIIGIAAYLSLPSKLEAEQ